MLAVVLSRRRHVVARVVQSVIATLGLRWC